MSALDIAALRRIAERTDADGRPWLWRGGYPQTVLREGDVILVAETFEDPDQPVAFAEFISTFDPPTVLVLLDGYRSGAAS
ncbi:MAG: hypothetical protein ACYCQK_01950 [Acidiferrobacteraceae bacterium]